MSIWLYIVTFVFGIGLDYLDTTKTFTKVLRITYIIWLFAFLCFGYMTGSDWRNYEIMYQDIYDYGLEFSTEIAFFFVFHLLSVLIPDFFISLAILKIAFLVSLIFLLKKLTTYWMSAIAILLPISLIFLLIDNPLRFMVALTFFNLSFIACINKNWGLFSILAIVAVLCHNASICCFAFVLFYLFSEQLYKIPSWALLLAYGVSFGIALNTQWLYHILTNVIESSTSTFGTSTYAEAYLEDVSETTGVMQIGYLLNFCIFLFLLWTRSSSKITFFTTHQWYKQIFVLTAAYFIFQPMAAAIPVGYRLIMPGGFFLAIIMTELMHEQIIIRIGFAVYFITILIQHVWFHFTYIPYTNSIPYIITQKHLPYDYRYYHNLDEYKKRFNKEFESVWE